VEHGETEYLRVERDGTGWNRVKQGGADQHNFQQTECNFMTIAR
jgi:hypothetical protein